MRLSLDEQLKDRPTLIVFAVPIMLSAYCGGLLAGLVATTLTYLGATFFLLPPTHSFRITSVVDRWDMLFVLLAGVIISLLNEALHRARRKAAIASLELKAQLAIAKAEALHSAILNSTAFWSIATDAKGVIQIFNAAASSIPTLRA